jgi:tRNA threonylcarbamoyladenosine biosynthesis protein TsaE
MNEQTLFIRFRELDELNEVAARLLALGSSVPVWLFKGEMGVGKTTLIKKIGEQLGIRNTIQSPTFSIINEYSSPRGERLFHFDFYRIKNEEEAYDIGTEEYLFSGHYCFVEWPEKVKSLWPETYVEIDIKQEEGQERSLRAAIVTEHSNPVDNK